MEQSRARVRAALAGIPTGARVIAVVGPTACGKSDVAIALCREFNGEAISADSRQVFRGLDLGTGKVPGALDTARGRRIPALDRGYEVAPLVSGGVDHWLLDVADPRDVFTAAEYQLLAWDVMADVARRGRLPVLVGGTGLYLRAVLDGLVMPAVPPDAGLRASLEGRSADELRPRLLDLDPEAGALVDLQNPRRMVRAIEVAAAAGPLAGARALEPVGFRSLTLGIRMDRETLLRRVQARLLQRLDEGMVDEVRGLLAAGVTPERMEDLGLEYRYVTRHLRGQLSRAQMTDELQRAIARFARRQMTWFRKHGPVVWVATPDEARARVAAFLSSPGQDPGGTTED